MRPIMHSENFLLKIKKRHIQNLRVYLERGNSKQFVKVTKPRNSATFHAVIERRIKFPCVIFCRNSYQVVLEI